MTGTLIIIADCEGKNGMCAEYFKLNLDVSTDTNLHVPWTLKNCATNAGWIVIDGRLHCPRCKMLSTTDQVTLEPRVSA